MLNLEKELEQNSTLSVVNKIKKNEDYNAAIDIITNRKYRKMIDNQIYINKLIRFVLRCGKSDVIFNLITKTYITTAIELDLKYILTNCVHCDSNLSVLVLKRTLDYMKDKYDIDKKLIRLNIGEYNRGYIKGFMFLDEKGC